VLGEVALQYAAHDLNIGGEGGSALSYTFGAAFASKTESHD
jgi:hypothetical protein